MKISARSDVGKIRESNQDAYAMGELAGGAVWAVVCDGMGGHAGGNIASSIAVEAISQTICSSFRSSMGFSAIKNLFSSAISAANVKIYDRAKNAPLLKGMGTTAVVVIAFGSNAYVAHVGDSLAGVPRVDAHGGDDDLAVRWLLKQVDTPDKGAFPRAGQTDDAEDLPVVYGQVDILQGHDLFFLGAVGFGQVL